jgi:hypothetical protein
MVGSNMSISLAKTFWTLNQLWRQNHDDLWICGRSSQKWGWKQIHNSIFIVNRTCFLSFFAVASDIILRRYKVIVWPDLTFSRRKSPYPAPGTLDIFTASPGNRQGLAYFRGWPSNGLRKTFRRGRTTCTGSENRTGGRRSRMLANSNLSMPANHH